jgi:hypothetical protein
MQAVAFSGGDDSTAMALRLAELGEDFVLLFTPAGNELPELFAHVALIAEMTGKELIQPPNRSLAFWIDHHNALPSWRMRWCTRQIKIQPCIDWLVQHPGSTLSVGLRADEEARTGLYGDYATYRYPLREWRWNDPDVHAYNRSRGVTVSAMPPVFSGERGVPGMKPEAFCFWLFTDIFGLKPDDEFVDLFAGSGAVAEAWRAFQRQPMMFARESYLATDLPLEDR